MRSLQKMGRAALGMGCLLAAAGFPAVRAASSTAWEMSTYRDFVSGRFNGVSLTRDGRLTLAPKAEPLFVSGQPAVWSVVQAADGTLFAGTGHRGRVYRIEPSGKSEVLWTADQPEVFALALDKAGALYAATSPDGKVYRIANGKAQEYYAPQARYIWSLAFGKDGALYAGTGDQGKVFRITGPGQGELYYETGQGHVTCLAVDGTGLLLAGTEPNGIIYRVTGKDKAFALYDASLPEVRTLIPAADGTVYVAALGGSLMRRTAGMPGQVYGGGGNVSVSGGTTTITVTEDGTAAQGGAEIKPKPEAAKPAQPAPQAAPAAPAPVLDLTGVEKSAVYRINPDNTVETLWSSKEENVYDLLLSGNQLVFSTDSQGRVYRLSPDRKLTLMTQTSEGETTRLLSSPAGLLAATGDMGKIFRIGTAPALSGTYEAPVHDVGTVAKWGRLSWRGDGAEKSRIEFRTRSGNSSRPDRTWSEWSDPLADAAGSPVTSPNARYVQWKAEFTAAAGGGPPPALETVALAYLPQNTAPVLKAINVISMASAGAGKAQQQANAVAASAAAATYSITVTDTGEAGQATSAGTPTQTLSRVTGEQIQITWQVEDAEGDRMTYAVYFRGEDEREWKLLKGQLTESTYSLDGDVLADGKYTFRVTASDGPSNPPSSAREAELVSAPVVIDHTPPTVVAGAPRRTGDQVEMEFNATDAASPLRRAEYSLDAAPWVPMEPADGVIDSEHEEFVLRIKGLSLGEHLIVVRAFDTANNAGLAKVVVR